jgi:hypothetical protein
MRFPGDCCDRGAGDYPNAKTSQRENIPTRKIAILVNAAELHQQHCGQSEIRGKARMFGCTPAGVCYVVARETLN